MKVHNYENKVLNIDFLKRNQTFTLGGKNYKTYLYKYVYLDEIILSIVT